MFSARLTIQIKSNLRPVTTVTVVAGYHLENIKNMKREDKELLFKDLSARLPYHVRCKIWLKDRTTEEGPLDLEHNYGDVLQHAFYYNDIKEIKPYLRPMSSMTEKEIDELKRICDEDDSRDECGEVISTVYGMTVLHGEVEDVYPYNVRIEISPNLNYAVLDFLNAHHLDYRGLILMGLAIEAPKGMYNF